jgi:hypothetical protein
MSGTDAGTNSPPSNGHPLRMASLKETTLSDLVDLNNITLIYHKRMTAASKKKGI